MLDTDAVRAAFPILARCVYLNTAAAGLSWRGQGRAAAEFYDSGKAKGMGGADEWAEKVNAARAELGSLMRVAPHSIQFLGSTTEALNLVALSLPLKRGDQVVVAQDEFPSVVQAWLGWQNRGIELVQVAIADELERTEALCAAINNGVRALAVSHIHWRTGTRVDLEKLSARCREFDCRLIVDGVQAVGAVPVDASLADAYCASVFKWLLSGFGLGFVTLGERLAGELSPVLRGYNNEPPSRSLRYGHLNYPGIYALLASLEYLRSVGWDAIHRQVDDLALRAIASLRSRGFQVITPVRDRGGIISIQHPSASTLVQALAEQSIHVEDRGAVIRASPHFYNTEEDIDRFVSALARSA
ncbi:MAG TPA: aminotransferase class V-fold PLP-dependent enzyme [Steroidobacteraceae bacterium]|nr:aminotransferase class V-fold PLP-dependent enzyme [Steroidobacteraceae bacterium]